MTEASNDFLFVEIAGRCFEATDRLHLAVHVEGFIARHFDSAGRFVVKMMSFVGLACDKKENEK